MRGHFLNLATLRGVQVSGMDEAFEIINDRPKPLSLYAFTSSKAFRERVINETSAGAVCINETALHVRGSATLFFYKITFLLRHIFIFTLFLYVFR